MFSFSIESSKICPEGGSAPFCLLLLCLFLSMLFGAASCFLFVLFLINSEYILLVGGTINGG